MRSIAPSNTCASYKYVVFNTEIIVEPEVEVYWVNGLFEVWDRSKRDRVSETNGKSDSKKKYKVLIIQCLYIIY